MSSPLYSHVAFTVDRFGLACQVGVNSSKTQALELRMVEEQRPVASHSTVPVEWLGTCCPNGGTFRVANARVELERAQTYLSGEPVQTSDKGTSRARLRHVVRPTLFLLRLPARRRRRLQRVSG